VDLLQIIKLISIPKWVKFLSLAIIALFMGLAIYAIFGGAYLAEGAILQAGMGLLGILLPLAIAILLLSFYEAGVRPLKRATEKVLTQLLPDVLSHLRPWEASGESVRVRFAYVPEHACRYLIEFSGGVLLRLEIELNVRKVSLVFYFDEGDFHGVEKSIEHTLAGAEKEGYIRNGVSIFKEWDGVPYRCLVLYKALAPDFLWNSAEKLYFAQDLQAMLNSLVWERSGLLAMGAGRGE
jgi:hypothetical protein